MNPRIDSITEALATLESLVVEQLMSEKARAQFRAGEIAKSELLPFVIHLKRLSDEYVSDRHYAIPPLGIREAAIAYALYFMPINFAKVLYLLHELPLGDGTKPVSVLDYGCGTGTAALATKQYFGGKVELTIVDHAPIMLEVAKQLLQASGVKSVHSGIPSEALASGRTFDLIIAANVLTELPDEKRLSLARHLAERLNPGGALLILEPAIRTVTQQTMRLRDALLSDMPQLTPIFPCTRRDHCPMLKTDPESWCHGTLRWEPSRLVNQLDDLSGFNKHRLKYTAFIFKRDTELRRGLRIIEEADRRKFGTQVSLCGPDHFGPLIIKKKISTEIRKAVEHSDQFDLLDLELSSLLSA